MSDEEKMRVVEADPLPVPVDKKPWLSKTLWFNVLMGIMSFHPVTREWIHGREDLAMLVVSGVNMILRLVTSKSITLG